MEIIKITWFDDRVCVTLTKSRFEFWRLVIAGHVTRLVGLHGVSIKHSSTENSEALIKKHYQELSVEDDLNTIKWV